MSAITVGGGVINTQAVFRQCLPSPSTSHNHRNPSRTRWCVELQRLQPLIRRIVCDEQTSRTCRVRRCLRLSVNEMSVCNVLSTLDLRLTPSSGRPTPPAPTSPPSRRPQPTGPSSGYLYIACEFIYRISVKASLMRCMH